MRPGPTEAADYYRTYLDLVPASTTDRDLVPLLRAQLDETLAFLDGIPEDRAGHRYAPGKWSVREVVAHVVDAERMFGFRAFTFARGDAVELPSFEQDGYIERNDFGARTLRSLAGELALIRRGHTATFEHLRPGDLDRRGTASGCEFTVRALLWIMAGHELHHRRVLAARYC